MDRSRLHMFLVFSMAFFLIAFAAHGQGLEAARAAYAAGHFSEAERIASAHSGEPEAQLIQALCAIYRPQTARRNEGMQQLRALYDDEAAPLPIRIEAGLSYARLYQVLASRNMLQGMPEENLVEFYWEFIEFAQDAPQAPWAAQSIAALLAEDAAESGSAQGLREALPRLESFIAEYDGESNALAALHLTLETIYRDELDDFAAALRHAQAAIELGLAYVPYERAARYRMARMAHAGLGDLELARRYYEELLAAYPESREGALARAYLDDLSAEGVSP